MKKSVNIMISVIAVAILLVGMVFLANSQGLFSTIQGDIEVLDISCQTDTDCYDTLVGYGFPQDELKLQLEDYDLSCSSNLCEVSPK